MKTDRTEIVVILDRSGSMIHAKSDHEGGLKTFVNEQKVLPGDVNFTLIQFDDQNPCEVCYDRTPIGDVKDIVLIPRGWTPLLDAVGRGISHVQSRIKDENPDQVIVTDGQENASKEWTRAMVREKIQELSKGNWKFLFLGANVDAFAEGAGIGVDTSNSINYNNDSPVGVANLYAAVSSNVMRGRSAAQQGERWTEEALNFTDQQREAASGNDSKNPQWKG